VDRAELIIRNAVVTGANLFQVGLAGGTGSNSISRINACARLHDVTLHANEGRVGVLETNPEISPDTTVTGRLEAVDSTLCFASNLFVSAHTLASSGVGMPAGTVVLTRSLVTVSNALDVGQDGGLTFDIEGTHRGSEYGAIDAFAAEISGHIEARFGFAPAVGDFFDLIVTGSPTGMVNGVPSFSFSGGVVASLAAWVGMDATGNQVFRVGLIPQPEIADGMISNQQICLNVTNLLAGISYRVEQCTNLPAQDWVVVDTFIASGTATTWYGAVTGAVDQADYRITSP
jgi:hypothetical protein